MMSDDDRIRQKAYELWVEQGRPEGRAEENWERARQLVAEEDRKRSSTAAKPKRAAASKPAAKATPPKAAAAKTAAKPASAAKPKAAKSGDQPAASSGDPAPRRKSSRG